MTDSIVLAAALIVTLGASRAAAQDPTQTNAAAAAAAAQPGAALPGSAPAAKPAEAKRTVIKTKAKFTPSAAPSKPATIFDYQKEIGLSDDQVAQMKSMVGALEAKFRAEKATGEQDSAEVRRLLQTDGDIKDIRAKLQDLANLEVEHQIGEIEASRSVGKILTKDQQEKWRAIQSRMAAQRSGAPQPSR
jgi:hypothetical protein